MIKKVNPIPKIKETQRAVREKMLTLILGGFGLVAALAWNDAIQALVNSVLPKGNDLIGKFIYALLITIIVTIIALQLKKLSSGGETK